MSAKVFLDTNILVYAFDPESPEKRERALELIGGRHWCVSWQVVQEFANVALHRFATPIRPEDLGEYLDLVLWPRCEVFPSASLHRSAIAIHQQTGYRYYDSLIVASALASEAPVLYSEDLQDGRRIGPLTIRSPF